MRRGEVWWADLSAPWGRPVVLLARDEAYAVLTWVAVAPTTTTIRDNPTAIILTPEDDGVPRSCAVNLDHIQAVRTTWLKTRVVYLGSERIEEIDRAIHFALGLSNCPTRLS